MRNKMKSAFIVALVLSISVGFAAQKTADMVGTWSGLATLEGMDDANELVLVLSLKDGALAGHMTDQYGTLNESEIYDTGLAEGVFSFTVKGNGPNGELIPMVFKMEVDGDSMAGSLEIPDMGMVGEWKASKQK
jgi:hypothetical protein